MSNNYVLGRGELYFAAFKDGTKVPGGERYLGNTPEFNMTVESESLDHYNSDRGIREKDASVLLEINRTGTFITDNIDPKNVALFLLGDADILTQASAIGEQDALTAVEQGLYYQIGASASNPSGARSLANVTVTGTGGTPSYTEGTDYTIDLELGRLMIVEGGGIAVGTDIQVNYDLQAVSRTQIVTAATASIEGAMRFVSFNAQGEKRDFYMPYVKLSPNGDFALKGEEWQQLPFNVDIQTLDANTAAIYCDGRPYTV